MLWTRGPASDFDRLAKVTGDPGWSWEALLPTLIEVFFPFQLLLACSLTAVLR